jgi:predicted RNA methylase
MKLKALESALSQVQSFEEPKISLEQVVTSAHLASQMIFAASQYDDIVSDEGKGKLIGDFGVGTGMLSIACSLMGAQTIIGFDIDEDALSIARSNINQFEMENIDLVLTDLELYNFSEQKNMIDGEYFFDTVVMNPPFGTRNKGIDNIFLEKGMEASKVVYSLHKTSTRDFFIRKAEESNWSIEVIAELRYDLPKIHKFHKQKSKDIAVDLYRFTHMD